MGALGVGDAAYILHVHAVPAPASAGAAKVDIGGDDGLHRAGRVVIIHIHARLRSGLKVKLGLFTKKGGMAKVDLRIHLQLVGWFPGDIGVPLVTTLLASTFSPMGTMPPVDVGEVPGPELRTYQFMFRRE